MKALVIFFLAVLAVGPSMARFRRPLVRFPVFPHHGDQVYAGSLGGAPVGLYSRQQPGFFKGRYPFYFPRFHHPDNVYLASLGGAKVGAYTRYGHDGSGVYGASLGKAPVGMYSRQS